MLDCSHSGFHSGQGRYNRDAGALHYVIVCDDCEQELGEVASEAYQPQFDPRGNDPYLR